MSNAFTAAPAELGARGEEMIGWWMSKYGLLTEDESLQSGNRDVAIGSLVTFVQGKGQPPTELFVAFPELAEKYYSALQGVMPVEETLDEVAPEEKKLPEEEAAGE